MPDISMCSCPDCPLAWKCYRAQATPSEWQSMTCFKPNEDGTCDDYWPVQEEEKKDG